ncbi:unnamed protein product, partial [Ixodes hexagonus]
NRHHFPSLTLQAICDHRKKFMDLSTGHPSKVHDGRVFRTSSVAVKLPQMCSANKYHILEAVFNTKMSGTRVLIENAFADLKNRFRHLKQLEFWGVDFTTQFIIACYVLHNLCIDCGDVVVEDDDEENTQPLIRRRDEDEDEEETLQDGALRKLGELKRKAVLAPMGIC